MERTKKLFGEFEMTWRRVILFAVITAVYTAGVNVLPFLKETSFQDIAVNLEWWFLFAIFIVVNCRTVWEACAKCFVFFLISQPLIYLLEVPFDPTGWGLFRYYRWWFIMTLLTIPGAAAAFMLKKKNWLSVAVLSVATGYLAYQSAVYFRSALNRFPFHLLSAVFCLLLALLLVYVLLDSRKQRRAAMLVIALVFLCCFILPLITSGGASTNIPLGDGSWSCSVDDASVLTVEISDTNVATVTSLKNGSAIVSFTSAEGEEQSYCIVVNGKDFMIGAVD